MFPFFVFILCFAVWQGAYPTLPALLIAGDFFEMSRLYGAVHFSCVLKEDLLDKVVGFTLYITKMEWFKIN